MGAPAGIRREKAKRAISLASAGHWEEALEENRAILELFPRDVEAQNRLGKALSELGRYSEARAAFEKALQLSPSNTIARKNLERLVHLKTPAPAPVKKAKVKPTLFIEESGKSIVTALRDLAPKEVLAKVAAGEALSLKQDGSAITAVTVQGERLGNLDPRLSRRLLQLMGAGNRYEAAVLSVKEREASVIIREVYQHPDLVGVVSFPTKGKEAKPYVDVTEGLEVEAEVAPEPWPSEGEGETAEAVGEGEPRPRPRKKPVAEDEEEEEEQDD